MNSAPFHKIPKDWIDIEIDEDGDELHSLNQKKMEDAFHEIMKNARSYSRKYDFREIRIL